LFLKFEVICVFDAGSQGLGNLELALIDERLIVFICDVLVGFPIFFGAMLLKDAVESTDFVWNSLEGFVQMLKKINVHEHQVHYLPVVMLPDFLVVEVVPKVFSDPWHH
jgi:hypothetical protein